MSPVIHEYLKRYQEDPTSKVFAPLAEAYRRAGLTKEAIEIAEEGLRVHPKYHTARVTLARAYFDAKDYTSALDHLEQMIYEVPDNLLAQRLIAESNLMLGRIPEALLAYKMVLYFNPSDRETAQIVRELEQQAYAAGAPLVREEDLQWSSSMVPVQEPDFAQLPVEEEPTIEIPLPKVSLPEQKREENDPVLELPDFEAGDQEIGFTVESGPVFDRLPDGPTQKKNTAWMKKVEFLQGLLMRVSDYRQSEAASARVWKQ